LADENLLENKKAKKWIQRFQEGWIINSLFTHEQINKYASHCGFKIVERQNLTPYLELNRPRDYIIRLLIKILGKVSLRNQYLQMLYGGNALQKCLSKHWINHELIVWQKLND